MGCVKFPFPIEALRFIVACRHGGLRGEGAPLRQVLRFEQCKRRVQQLWAELRIPQREQVSFQRTRGRAFHANRRRALSRAREIVERTDGFRRSLRFGVQLFYSEQFFGCASAVNLAQLVRTA